MAWTTPTAVNTGAIITQTYTEQIIRDNLLYLKDRADNPPRAFVYHSATQSIANGTDTAVACNSEILDSAALHDTATNNSRLTVPSGETGIWLFAAYVEFDANATGQRKLVLRHGGSQTMAALTVDAAAGSQPTRLTVTTILSMSAAEYMEAVVSQNSGGALNLASVPRFSAQRIA